MPYLRKLEKRRRSNIHTPEPPNTTLKIKKTSPTIRPQIINASNINQIMHNILSIQHSNMQERENYFYL